MSAAIPHMPTYVAHGVRRQIENGRRRRRRLVHNNANIETKSPERRLCRQLVVGTAVFSWILRERIHPPPFGPFSCRTIYSTALFNRHLSFGAFLLRSHRLVIRLIHSEASNFSSIFCAIFFFSLPTSLSCGLRCAALAK